jgi:hypothetical protein
MINRRLSSILLVVVLLASQAMFAAGGILEITLSDPVLLAGKQLGPGDYLVRWKTSSPEATVRLETRGTVVAELTARVEERDQAADRDTVLTAKNAAGELVLKEIRIRGKKQVLVF